MIENIIQIIILVMSVLCIYMISTTGKYQRYGFIVGITVQPLWIYSTYTKEQYGMVVISIIYTLIHINGIYQRFIKK